MHFLILFLAKSAWASPYNQFKGTRHHGTYDMNLELKGEGCVFCEHLKDTDITGTGCLAAFHVLTRHKST